MLAVLDAVLLQPLMQVYASLFAVLPDGMSLGARIILFGVIVNLLLLPVYAQMEKQSRSLRDVRDLVARDARRMRQHFRGRERYFYVRAVHRQYGYNPIRALLGSSDLFIQILVFATVYRFLSGFEPLHGESFGPIADLGSPDALLRGINVLPFLMTAINAASVFAYVDDGRKRLQALTLAALFLILLYASPAGLVLYWTTNNAFSYVRNIAVRRVLPGLPERLTRRLAMIAAQQ